MKRPTVPDFQSRLVIGSEKGLGASPICAKAGCRERRNEIATNWVKRP
jgi:hypothetical protein